MWVDSLRSHTIGLDTGPFIYFIERNVTYAATVRPFFVALAAGLFQAVTSMVTLEEVLVISFREGRPDLVDRYRTILLHSAGLSTMPVDQEIAEEAARIRAVRGRIRTPDAIQMATATVGGASYFLTNDTSLPDLPNLQMLVVDNLAQE